MTDSELYSTITYYRKNRHQFDSLTSNELEILKENMGEWFVYIANKQLKLKSSSSSKTRWKAYRKIVMRLTKQQDTSLLENSDKPRATCVRQMRSTEHYVIDHKISVWYGFKNNIPPTTIADITNLRWVSALENTIKGTNCIFD